MLQRGSIQHGIVVPANGARHTADSKRLKELFAAVDANGDGVLDRAEFNAAFHGGQLGRKPVETRGELINYTDPKVNLYVDPSGKIL